MKESEARPADFLVLVLCVYLCREFWVRAVYSFSQRWIWEFRSCKLRRLVKGWMNLKVSNLYA